MDASAEKEKLRALARTRRKKAHEQLSQIMPQRLAEHFFECEDPRVRGIGPVAGYVAIRDETDPSFLLSALHDRGIALALPRILEQNAPLAFLSWCPGDPLERGAYGINEPAISVAEIRPRVVFVPLLAYDGKGRRLGYGGGYYDRSLAALRTGQPKPIALGIAYADQQLETLAEEPYDERLDGVLTENGLTWFTSP